MLFHVVFAIKFFIAILIQTLPGTGKKVLCLEMPEQGRFGGKLTGRFALEPFASKWTLFATNIVDVSRCIGCDNITYDEVLKIRN